MFGDYPMHRGGGVNPPHAPAYPMEWDAKIRTVEVVTEVRPSALDEILGFTPFERVNNRVAFRFMLSPWHTLALQSDGLFDLMVTVPVRYQGLFTQTHVFMYCSDAMGITAGRELFGYTKKECTFLYRETAQGSVSGWVDRRGTRLADFSFTPDPDAPPVRLVDGPEQPHGELHVRRLPHPAKPEPAYADVVYRDMPIDYVDVTPGRVEMRLHPSDQDPLSALEPRILGAQQMHTEVFGGGLAVEDRRILDRLV
ncbi:MAG TPA: acetoacetate decarboxylase family protein [Nocardioidaceae bacterium]|nr:acetoacetate decarboxylase family protein [Nocardioidaceae bacterium]